MIAQRASEFCCGVIEIGNFNYVKDRGPKGLPHYHRGKSRGWEVVGKDTPTTEAELRGVLNGATRSAGAVVCTTGADQEYMDELLTMCGFKQTAFFNKIHEQGQVKFWILASRDYVHKDVVANGAK